MLDMEITVSGAGVLRLIIELLSNQYCLILTQSCLNILDCSRHLYARLCISLKSDRAISAPYTCSPLGVSSGWAFIRLLDGDQLSSVDHRRLSLAAMVHF